MRADGNNTVKGVLLLLMLSPTANKTNISFLKDSKLLMLPVASLAPSHSCTPVPLFGHIPFVRQHKHCNRLFVIFTLHLSSKNQLTVYLFFLNDHFKTTIVYF